METAERVLALYRETYLDLSVQQFHEKLPEEHAIELGADKALCGSGNCERHNCSRR